MEIFKIQDLTYYYPENKLPALKNINLTINEGDFILLIGKSGSGKSTLARVFNGIIPEFYGGKISGKLRSNCSSQIGFVFQDPEKQIVMDTIEREIAFTLENMGKDINTMKKNVAETINYMNLWDIKDKKVYKISGGQKQKTVIASILAMGSRFLIFDEPTSQLDPSSADEVLSILKRLNEDYGYTIILAEQKMDRCFNLADRIILINKGQIRFDGSKNEYISNINIERYPFLPPISRFFVDMNANDIPLTVKEGRSKLSKYKIKPNYTKKEKYNEKAIEIKNVYFSYDDNIDVLNDVNTCIYKGSIHGIMGENGSGKTTLLKNIVGLLKPDQGSIDTNGKISYLSQNPNDYLFNDTLYKELEFTLDSYGIRNKDRINDVLKSLDILKYKDNNPRDLSTGERQRAALASILVTYPDILILDEPTRGLDIDSKSMLGNILFDLKKKGKTVIVVTHDVEFAAEYTDNISLMFKGDIIQTDNKNEVLSSGLYYSTQINKLFKGFSDKTLTIEEALDVVDTDRSVTA